MIPDALTNVSSAQQVTADAVSEDYFDAGSMTPKRNLAVGTDVALFVCITAIGTNTGSAKLQAIQSATAGLGSGTQILGQIDLATADIAAGKIYRMSSCRWRKNSFTIASPAPSMKWIITSRRTKS